LYLETQYHVYNVITKVYTNTKRRNVNGLSR